MKRVIFSEKDERRKKHVYKQKIKRERKRFLMKEAEKHVIQQRNKKESHDRAKANSAYSQID